RVLDRTRAPGPGARSGSGGAGGGGATAGGGADPAGARSLPPSGPKGVEGRGALDRGRERSGAQALGLRRRPRARGLLPVALHRPIGARAARKKPPSTRATTKTQSLRSRSLAS